MSKQPQYYARECFESLPASELLANKKHQYWLADGRSSQYRASKVTTIYLEEDGIYISYEIKHGIVYPPNEGAYINQIDLDNRTCEITRIVSLDAELLVLKREHEPAE